MLVYQRVYNINIVNLFKHRLCRRKMEKGKFISVSWWWTNQTGVRLVLTFQNEDVTPVHDDSLMLTSWVLASLSLMMFNGNQSVIEYVNCEAHCNMDKGPERTCGIFHQHDSLWIQIQIAPGSLKHGRLRGPQAHQHDERNKNTVMPCPIGVC